MIIIVEAGATKSDWRIIGPDGQRRMLLPGMNVSTISMENNVRTLFSGLDQAGAKELDGFYLYTAGIVTPEVRERLTACVHSLVDVREVEVQDDLMAAARAACGHSEGIVAILGTGSNACWWDGNSVSFKVRSGGYIIGDEGGGACLGKLFLGDLIKGIVPEPVAEDFASSHDASYEGIVQLVYRSEAPAGALGSLAPWLLERYDSSPYVRELIDGNFRSFIRRSLLHYDVRHYPVGVVGGWGNACRDIFSRLCDEAGIRLRGFVSEPIEGLIAYHSA